MRAGCSTVQQSLTTEAAAIVKQAVSLARRRGHAQVTPLHVANVMLSSSSGIFRSACLQSHSHPLQCKALELCFNVALNRLPASTASSVPMLTSHQPYSHNHLPSLSNALVAAFKRAQAQQRRGSIESQQQPLLAVKIEVEQLMASILDDPSVSRVMREAGFSSTQVKNNVEKAASLEISESSPLSVSPQILDQVNEEDVKAVVEILASRRKKSVAVVGEYLAAAEGVVKAVIDGVGKRGVPKIFENLQFISLPLISLRNLSTEEVEQKIGELRSLLMSFCGQRGVILYLGDLKWVAEYGDGLGGKGRSCYCPVEHLVMELGRIFSRWSGEESGEGRFWLIGSATYQTYLRCKTGNPSLEALWGLFPITIPSGSLRLSLSCESEKCRKDLSLSRLPSWLQQSQEAHRQAAASHETPIEEPGKMRNACSSPGKTLYFFKQSPCGQNQSTKPLLTSSSETMEEDRHNGFKELSAENLNALCLALEKKATWQKDIVPDIAATVLRCRSGMARRKKSESSSMIREDTWMLFQGDDNEGKERIARGLGSLIFGHSSCFVSFGSIWRDEERSKRSRSDAYASLTEKLGDAISGNIHAVVLIDDVEQMDNCTKMNLRSAIERGKVTSSDGEEVKLGDAIIILSCESFDSKSRACSPAVKQKLEDDDEGELEGQKAKFRFKSLDLNLAPCDQEELQIRTSDEIDLLAMVDGRFFFKLKEDF